MLARLGKIILSAFLLSGLPVIAAEDSGQTWECTISLPNLPDQVSQFQFWVEGDELVSDSGRLKILENNEFSIVAVSSMSGMTAHWGAMTGANVIVIRKPNGELLRTNTFFDEAFEGGAEATTTATQGQCHLVS